ncbi:transcriptional regulator, MarR family, partial [sediment metagenome]
MKAQDLKYLQLVQELSEERGLTQRDLFLRLGMAQGLVNRYLKRLAQKGWIKLTT